MEKDWRDSDKAKERLKEVLRQSGVPLETRVLELVSEFCNKHSRDPLRASALGPIMWGKTPETAYRELDAGALLREVMSFPSPTVEVVTEAFYFIEAKYRQGVEWFAFESPHSARIPTASNAAYCESVVKTYRAGIEELPIFRLTGVKTEGGIQDLDKSTPHKEQLTQNASAALSDLVLHVAKHSLPVVLNEKAESIGRQSGIPSAYLMQTQGDADWRGGLMEYLKCIPTRAHQDFLTKCNGPHPVIVRLFIPIMVVNGRLNHVKMSDGEIQDVLPMSYVVTGERIPSWPGTDMFVDPSAHFPLFVTDTAGLTETLQTGYDYVWKVRNAFFNAGARDLLNSAAFESVVASLILEEKVGLKPRLFRGKVEGNGDAI